MYLGVKILHIECETRITRGILCSPVLSLKEMYTLLLREQSLCLLSQRCLWLTLAVHNILTFHFQHEFLPCLLSLIVMNAFIFSAIEYKTSVKIRVSLFYLHQIFPQLLPFSWQYNCRWYPVPGCHRIKNDLAEAIASYPYLPCYNVDNKLRRGHLRESTPQKVHREG